MHIGRFLLKRIVNDLGYGSLSTIEAEQGDEHNSETAAIVTLLAAQETMP